MKKNKVDIAENIFYVGVDDKEIDLFEGQYRTDGMCYNSYVIVDERVALFDGVDARFSDVWLGNVAELLGDRATDYFIVQHMEPEHSASVIHLVKTYPEVTVVATKQAFMMMDKYFGQGFAKMRLVVDEGDTLSLGKHTLHFVKAPMVHWPEVMVTYEESEKILFSADAFGKFGLYGNEDGWVDEARRYYIGIVGKYGAQVQALLKKVTKLDIGTICPLHGPILNENLGYYIDLYNIWSSYTPEEEGVVIAYTSIYGNTKAAVMQLRDELCSMGCRKVVVNDLARCDMAEAVEDAFRYSKLVLATTTYNADVFPFMREFINHLTERNYQNRTVALVENGSWAPTAAKVMRGMLEACKNITFTENTVKIISALNDQSREEITALAKELCN